MRSLQVFRVVSVCLGCPPETICWEYRDKDKNFHRLGPLTPLEFYREHVKPLYNIEDKVGPPSHVDVQLDLAPADPRRSLAAFRSNNPSASTGLPRERPPAPESVREAVHGRVSG